MRGWRRRLRRCGGYIFTIFVIKRGDRNWSYGCYFCGSSEGLTKNYSETITNPEMKRGDDQRLIKLFTFIPGQSEHIVGCLGFFCWEVCAAFTLRSNYYPENRKEGMTKNYSTTITALKAEGGDCSKSHKNYFTWSTDRPGTQSRLSMLFYFQESDHIYFY